MNEDKFCDSKYLNSAHEAMRQTHSCGVPGLKDKEYMRHDLVWIDSKLPFVVTRQPEFHENFIIVAQCTAPDKTVHSRLSRSIAKSAIILHNKPLLLKVLIEDQFFNWRGALNAKQQHLIGELCSRLNQNGLELRVYGSYSWQFFTQRQFIHNNSDLDILLYISEVSQLKGLDTYLYQLQDMFGCEVDGELVLDNQYFISWREWFNDSNTILVKTNTQIFLIDKVELFTRCLSSYTSRQHANSDNIDNFIRDMDSTRGSSTMNIKNEVTC